VKILFVSQWNIFCLPKTGWKSGSAKHVRNCLWENCREAGRIWRIPFSPVATHLHKQPVGKRSSTKECAGNC